MKETKNMQYLRNNIKILIIDDNTVFANNLKNLIQHAAENRIMEIDIEHTGEDGLHKLQSKVYDFVFVDIDLPGMSGIQLTKIFDRENSHKMVKIIGISFHEEFEYLEQMLTAGASKYLVKDKINLDTIEAILNAPY